jgi:hypothetical protein
MYKIVTNDLGENEDRVTDNWRIAYASQLSDEPKRYHDNRGHALPVFNHSITIHSGSVW